MIIEIYDEMIIDSYIEASKIGLRVMRDDINIHQFVEKILTDRECQDLVEIYNHRRNSSRISIGLLPFVTHSTIINILQECKQGDLTNQFQSQHQQIYDPDHPSNIDTLLDKLDVNNYWVDITRITDPHRLEYNTVTEEYRATLQELQTRIVLNTIP